MSVYNKFFVAALIAGANAIRSRYGIDFGMDDKLAYDLVNGAGAALVWLIPNRAV